MGLTLPILVPPATQPTTQPSTGSTAVATTMPVTTPTTQPTKQLAAVPTTRPAAEQRVDKFLVSGADIRFEDHTVSPPLVVPVNSLDVDVRGLSNWAAYQNDRPIRYSVLLSGGKVSLPRRIKNKGLAGLFSGSDAAPTTRPSDATAATEERELFSLISSNGNLSLYPKPKGWTKTTVSGFDLSSMRGPSKAAGFALANGEFDLSVETLFPGDGSTVISAIPSVTDLDIAEPKGGPIAKLLSLPLGLDFYKDLLTDSEGSLALPINGVTIPADHASPEGVGGAVAGAVAGILIKSGAAAPAKMLNTGLGMIGLDLGGGKKKPEPPVVIRFAAGDTGLSAAAEAQLVPLVKKLRDDEALVLTFRHELGEGDVAAASIRANPGVDDALSMAYRLRQRKTELLKQRPVVGGQARSQLALNETDRAAATIECLRGIDRDLAQTEESLEKLYEMVRPGAERQATRRTRGAGLVIAQDRLAMLQSAVLRNAGPGVAERVHAPHAQFVTADDAPAGGRITVTLTHEKKK